MAQEPRLVLSKLDVVRRQLVTAVTLFFNDRDPVSIHTLTMAAYEILSDLSRKAGMDKLIVDWAIEATVKSKERQKMLRKCVREAQNFFKHADRDSNAVHRFHPDAPTIFLYAGCARYREITRERFPELEVYELWYKLAHADPCVLTSEEKSAQRTLAGILNNRLQFLTEALPLAASLKP